MEFDELLAVVSSGNGPGVCIDSRLVMAGDIFVAIPGANQDGGDFIGDAIAHGAKYIVCRDEQHAKVKDDLCRFIRVANPAKAAGLLTQANKGDPASRLVNLAVTGTNGKTTVTFLVRSCIRAAGKKCGLIGTVVYDTCLNTTEAPLTTPDCLSLADAQQKMVEAGAEYMVIEASSHALYQDRLAGIEFKAAAFTNLTGDHLDFHKTKEAYLAAKTRLFSSLSSASVAVLNKQSPEAHVIAEQTNAPVLWYAIDEPADVTAHIESMGIMGTVFRLDCSNSSSGLQTPDSRLLVRTLLFGRYNVANCLAAAGLCLAAGLNLETIAHGLSSLPGVPGRLEKVEHSGVRGQGSGAGAKNTSDERRATSHVFVDYAHTDDALQNVLSTLKPLCKGRLIVVFGCGGDRDKTKRPRMARVAEQLADVVIVTSDNPRTEQPQAIIDEIVAGFENASEIRTIDEIRYTKYDLRATSDERRATKLIEPDRRKAIGLAIESASDNDIVLIAGKGHETYQIIGTQKIDFDDKAVAQKYLSKRTVGRKMKNSCSC